jgi:hypothetical protein
VNAQTRALLDALGTPETTAPTTVTVRYQGPASAYFQRGRDYTVSGWPDNGYVYIVEADKWADGDEFKYAEVETVHEVIDFIRN